MSPTPRVPLPYPLRALVETPRRLPRGGARLRALLCGAGALACVWGAPGHAEEVGRYQAVSLLEGGRTGASGNLQPRVLILDTVEGHLWTWEENVRLEQPGKPPAFGTAIVYQGRVRPGTRIGEVVEQVTRN